MVRAHVQHLTACSTMRNIVLHNYTDVLLETRSMQYVNELRGQNQTINPFQNKVFMSPLDYLIVYAFGEVDRSNIHLGNQKQNIAITNLS